MEHTLASGALRVSPVFHAAAPLRGRAAKRGALLVRIVGVAALVAASVAAIADQSPRFVSGQEIVGVQEIPALISGRVELTPGLSTDGLAPSPWSDLSRSDPSTALERAPGTVRTATAGAPAWSSR